MNSISLKRIMNLQGPHEISGTRGQALRSNLTNYLPGTGRPTNKRKVERGDRPPVPPQPTTSPDTGRPTSLVPVTNVAQTGLSGSEVLMVGNDPIADIRGADSVGMKSRYIHSWQSPPRGFSLPESCGEIMSLEELLEDR